MNVSCEIRLTVFRAALMKPLRRSVLLLRPEIAMHFRPARARLRIRKIPIMSDVRPLRIFLVENHTDTLKWLTLYLQQMGHTVASARTMEDALVALPHAACEVLISDIGLPDGDGWQLLQRLRDEARALPGYAIAMSGYGMNADRSKSKAVGYSEHILKPFKAAELQAILREAARTLDE